MAQLTREPKPSTIPDQSGELPAVLTENLTHIATETSRRIVDKCDYAKYCRDLVLICGQPGVGKTEALMHYKATTPRVWLMTASRSAKSMRGMLQDLAATVGVGTWGASAELSRRIIARVKDSDGLIIVDEAQHYGFDPLESLRGIFDFSGIGMVLSGDLTLRTTLAKFPQLDSRIGSKLILKRPSHQDVSEVAAVLGVAGEEELRFCHSIAQHGGGLRYVAKTIRQATILAAGEGVRLDIRHLAAAWKELDLEDAP